MKVFIIFLNSSEIAVAEDQKLLQEKHQVLDGKILNNPDLKILEQGKSINNIIVQQ
jgi:hypothetical protein